MNRLKDNAFGILVLLIGLYLLPGRVTGPKGDGMPGDLGDTRFNNYMLEHGHQYLTGEVESFWSAPFMYPEDKVVSYADNLIGVFPLYSLFRFAGFDRETSLQGWFWLVCALNFLSAWWVLKKLTGNSAAAAMGAYLFAFGLPVIAQINHLQLLPRFFVPLAVYGLVRFVGTRDARFMAVMLGALLLQFYGSMYLGFLLFFCLAVAGCGMVIINKVKLKGLLITNRKNSIWLAGSLVAFAVLMWPLYSEYSARSAQVGMRAWDEISPLLPSVRSFFYPGGQTLFWDVLSANGTHLKFPWEHVMFPGGLAVLVSIWLIVLLYKWKNQIENRELVLLAFVVIAFVLLMFINVGGYSLYIFLKKGIPGFGSMRAPARVILILLFFVSLIVSLGVALMIQRYKEKSKLVIAVLGLLMVGDQYVFSDGLVKHSKAESQDRVYFLTERLLRAEKGPYKAFAYLGLPEDDANLLQLDAMMAAQASGWKTVNGYSSTAPAGYPAFWSNHDEAALREWLEFKGCKDSILILY